MKLISFTYKKITRLGHLSETNHIVDFASASHGQLPDNIMNFLSRGEHNRLLAKKIAANENLAHLPRSKVKVLAPVPHPASLRIGYSLRQYNDFKRLAKGLKHTLTEGQLPKYYYANQNTLAGSGDVYFQAAAFEKLDFEMGCAAVIGKRGRNISIEHADDYIAGFTIINDWTIRGYRGGDASCHIPCFEKKDLITSMGPVLVTKDELEIFRIPGDGGDRYDLDMRCTINGECVSEDNLKNMQNSFAELIVEASRGVELRPGDIFASGSCGTGSLLDLSNSRTERNRWLEQGDDVEIMVSGLGTLKNKILQIKE